MTKEYIQDFQTYFAGASIAFGLSFLAGEIVSLLAGNVLSDVDSTFLGIYYLSIHVLGGFVGGGLVARKMAVDKITRSGGITGLMAYLLHQVIYFLFYGGGVLGDPYTLFALLGGSLVGSQYIKQSRKNQEKEESEG
jgi:hypothetical protein